MNDTMQQTGRVVARGRPTEVAHLRFCLGTKRSDKDITRRSVEPARLNMSEFEGYQETDASTSEVQYESMSSQPQVEEDPQSPYVAGT